MQDSHCRMRAGERGCLASQESRRIAVPLVAGVRRQGTKCPVGDQRATRVPVVAKLLYPAPEASFSAV